MLKQQRIKSLILAVSLLLNLFFAINVSAADEHAGIVRFDMVYEDIITVNINVKKNEVLSYVMSLSAPKNVNDPHNTGNTYGYGALRFCANGELRLKPDGSWMPNDASGNVVGNLPADGNWYNIKMRVNRIEMNVEWYLDDEYLYTTSIDPESDFYKTKNPCSLIMFIEDSSYEDGGIEWDFVSAVGSKQGEINAVVTEFNESEKRIEVAFSESLTKLSELSNVVFKDTNGGREIQLNIVEATNEKVVYSYDEDLAMSSEYALIFPEGIKGEFGSSLSKRYYYLKTKSGYEATLLNSWDYENYNNTVDLTVMQTGGNPYIVDGGEGHGKSLNVDLYSGNAASNKWLNWVAPQGDVTSLSFSIKPLYSDLKFCLEFSNSAINSTPLYIAFAQSGDIVIGHNWPNAGWYDNAGMNGNWSGDGKTGKYSADGWIDFKIEFDDLSDKITVYINNTEVKTITGKIKSIDNVFGGIRFRGLNDLRSTGTPVLLFDDVKTESIVAPTTVKEIRFNGISGEAKGPFDTTDKYMENAKIVFSGAVEESTLNYETVQLLYDGQLSEYDGVYDAENMTYIIYPNVLPENDAKIEVKLSGVSDIAGNEVKSFSAYICADSKKPEFIVEKFNLTNEINGDIYADTAIVNSTDEEREVIVALMGYADNSLTEFSYKKMQIGKNGIFVMNPSKNQVKIAASGLDDVLLTIMDFESKALLKDSIRLGNNEFSGDIQFKETIKEFKDGKVSVEIYAPGKGFNDLEGASDFSDVLAYKNEIDVLEDGVAAFSCNLRENSKTGVYNIILSSKDKTKTFEYLYVNEQEAKECLENILLPAIKTGDVSEIAKVITENNQSLYVSDKYLDEDVAEIMAKLLIKYEKDENITSDNLKTVMNKALGVAALQEDKISDVLAEDEMFDIKNSNIGDLYEESFVNEKTGEIFTKRLKEKEYDTIEEFYDYIEECFILAVVENPVEPNSIKTVLNAFSIYAKNNDGYKNVAGNAYSDISDMKADLNKEESKKETGGTSGGRGGASGMHVTVPSIQPENKEEIRQEAVNTEVFTDIDSVLWAKEAILGLAEKKVINGKEAGKFYPNDNVLREEFTKMLVLAFNIEDTSKDHTFKDVNDGMWYADFVKKAYSAGIVKGYDERTFGVGVKITREDMALMIYRAAEFCGYTFETDFERSEFNDDANIADYAKESIYILENAGIINGTGGNNFSPKACATRAEAAKMIYGIINR